MSQNLNILVENKSYECFCKLFFKIKTEKYNYLFPFFVTGKFSSQCAKICVNFGDSKSLTYKYHGKYTAKFIQDLNNI